MSEKFDMNELLSNTGSIDWEQVQRERDEHARRVEWSKRHGWKDPRTGTCRVCSGVVVSDVRRKYDHSHPVIIGGPPVPPITIHNGYYYKECGLKYKFPPAPTGHMTDEELEQHE